VLKLPEEKQREEKTEKRNMKGTQGSAIFPPPITARTPYPILAAFDTKAKVWEDYTATPLGRLRQELTLRYLMQHLGSFPRSLKVLDAGGGTGSYALPLAKQGHWVCLLDFSAKMLAIAQSKVKQLDPSLQGRMDFCHASVEEIPRLFPPARFDLILCYTLLEYVSEPWEVLRILVTVLRPGGLISLLLTNPYADPLRWALSRGDLEKARLALHEQVSSADLFGLPRRTFPAEMVQEIMNQAELEMVAEYGVRIFADYLADEKLADPEFFSRLLELETVAGTLYPYRLIARYIQLLGRKPEV
jgi:S-adenosylmethionine-dependent methyltransferase